MNKSIWDQSAGNKSDAIVVSNINHINELLQYLQILTSKSKQDILTSKSKQDILTSKSKQEILTSKSKQESKIIIAGMDFEFDMINRGHELSLAQMVLTSFDKKTTQTSKVYIMDFRLFTSNQFNRFKHLILLNKNVVKILHGSESLDLPAMRKLIPDNSEFKLFLNQIIDTRYLCAAHHILLRKNSGIHLKKCNIYDSLKDTLVITIEDYNKLSAIKVNYHKPWRIKNLTEKQLTYAVGDVLFLYNLYVEYQRLLGDDLINVVMEAYRYAIITRMGLILADLPKSNQISKTTDLLEKLHKMNILSKPVALSPIGIFTIEDIISIDYLKKSAIHIAYDTFVRKS